MKITFLGASGTVTGSKYLLEFQGTKILIDCGMFQGLKTLTSLNWEKPEFDPSSIHAVFLTHGHLDHTGYLPRLVKLGFKGKIYATALTLKIAEFILKDSAKIQEEEAERANREGYSRHKPALPFYDLKDVEKTLPLFHPVQEGQWQTIEGLKVIFDANDVPWFWVDLAKHPWLASQKRQQNPFYRLAGTRDQWREYNEKVIQLTCFARGYIGGGAYEIVLSQVAQ